MFFKISVGSMKSICAVNNVQCWLRYRFYKTYYCQSSSQVIFESDYDCYGEFTQTSTSKSSISMSLYAPPNQKKQQSPFKFAQLSLTQYMICYKQWCHLVVSDMENERLTFSCHFQLGEPGTSLSGSVFKRWRDQIVKTNISAYVSTVQPVYCWNVSFILF